MAFEPGWVIAFCAATGTICAVGGWIGRHFVGDEIEKKKQPGEPAVTAASLEAALVRQEMKINAALAKQEISLLDRFNGRYPSKDIFNAGMKDIREQIVEVRKYIGDAKRQLTAQIGDDRRAGDEIHRDIGRRVDGIDGRVTDVEHVIVRAGGGGR
jgi:hypothetical protein